MKGFVSFHLKLCEGLGRIPKENIMTLCKTVEPIEGGNKWD